MLNRLRWRLSHFAGTYCQIIQGCMNQGTQMAQDRKPSFTCTFPLASLFNPMVGHPKSTHKPTRAVADLVMQSIYREEMGAICSTFCRAPPHLRQVLAHDLCLVAVRAAASGFNRCGLWCCAESEHELSALRAQLHLSDTLQNGPSGRQPDM